jgi:hypothetical protein
MAPAPLNTTERYINPEVTVTYWVTTVVDMAAPTREELDAGTSVDLTGEIAAMSGWEVSADRVVVPDLGSKKTGRITGRINPGDGQIVFYASSDTQDVRDVKQRGDTGFIYILDGGDVEGQKGRGFQVEVSSLTPTVDVGGTEGARIMVDYSINDWAEEITIPAESS